MNEVNTQKTAVILTQVATAEALAAACSLFKIKAVAVPSPIGAYAVLDDTSESRVQFAVAQLTSVIKEVPAILVTYSDEQMKAWQWQAGQELGRLSPALVMDGAPHELENVLFGSIKARDILDAVDSSKIGRFKAMRLLSAVAKQYKAKAE